MLVKPGTEWLLPSLASKKSVCPNQSDNSISHQISAAAAAGSARPARCPPGPGSNSRPTEKLTHRVLRRPRNS